MTRVGTSSIRRRITVKTRLTGGLLLIALAAALATAALAAGTNHPHCDLSAIRDQNLFKHWDQFYEQRNESL